MAEQNLEQLALDIRKSAGDVLQERSTITQMDKKIMAIGITAAQLQQSYKDSASGLVSLTELLNNSRLEQSKTHAQQKEILKNVDSTLNTTKKIEADILSLQTKTDSVVETSKANAQEILSAVEGRHSLYDSHLNGFRLQLEDVQHNIGNIDYREQIDMLARDTATMKTFLSQLANTLGGNHNGLMTELSSFDKRVDALTVVAENLVQVNKNTQDRLSSLIREIDELDQTVDNLVIDNKNVSAEAMVEFFQAKAAESNQPADQLAYVPETDEVSENTDEVNHEEESSETTQDVVQDDSDVEQESDPVIISGDLEKDLVEFSKNQETSIENTTSEAIAKYPVDILEDQHDVSEEPSQQKNTIFSKIVKAFMGE